MIYNMFQNTIHFELQRRVSKIYVSNVNSLCKQKIVEVMHLLKLYCAQILQTKCLPRLLKKELTGSIRQYHQIALRNSIHTSIDSGAIH